MPAEEMFTGFRFTRETIEELEALALRRSGGADQPYFDELKQRTAEWSEEQFHEVEQQGAQIERRLLALLREGVASDDQRVFAVLDDDVAAQRQLLVLNAEEYTKLGHAFGVAAELRAHLDAQDPRLAEYMRDAIVAYVAVRMA
jgi:TipAS antibiotic-recognition domain